MRDRTILGQAWMPKAAMRIFHILSHGIVVNYLRLKNSIYGGFEKTSSKEFIHSSFAVTIFEIGVDF